MSDNTTKTEKNRKSPAYIAYQVTEREGKDSFWTRIGVAFSHNDGKGYNIQFSAVPLDGRITLRLPTEKKE